MPSEHQGTTRLMFHKLFKVCGVCVCVCVRVCICMCVCVFVDEWVVTQLVPCNYTHTVFAKQYYRRGRTYFPELLYHHTSVLHILTLCQLLVVRHQARSHHDTEPPNALALEVNRSATCRCYHFGCTTCINLIASSFTHQPFNDVKNRHVHVHVTYPPTTLTHSLTAEYHIFRTYHSVCEVSVTSEIGCIAELRLSTTFPIFPAKSVMLTRKPFGILN